MYVEQLLYYWDADKEAVSLLACASTFFTSRLRRVASESEHTVVLTCELGDLGHILYLVRADMT